MCRELALGLDIAGAGQQFYVVSQLFTDVKAEAQSGGGPVVDDDGVLVEAVKHADFEVNILTLHPYWYVHCMGQGLHADLWEERRYGDVASIYSYQGSHRLDKIFFHELSMNISLRNFAFTVLRKLQKMQTFYINE